MPALKSWFRIEAGILKTTHTYTNTYTETNTQSQTQIYTHTQTHTEKHTQYKKTTSLKQKEQRSTKMKMGK